MQYTVKNSIGGRIIQDERAASIASFANDAEGQKLLGLMLTSLALSGASVYDAEAGKFLAGDVGQLDDEAPQPQPQPRTVANQFPDFDVATLPPLPEGWEDVSWHNDTRPSWLVPGAGVQVFIDYADASLSEHAEERAAGTMPRFCAVHVDEAGNETWCFASDDWADVLANVLAFGFAANIVRDASPFELGEIKRRNADPAQSPGACASHDFMDANMQMAEAFEAVTGADIDADDEAQAALWNQAWHIAHASFLTEGR